MYSTNYKQLVESFNRFRQSMTPAAAEKQVQQLVQSGRLSPQQLERLKIQATFLMKYLK